ncbi:MAG: energy transducer TonB [Phycisphaeraceae bacterium]|nr:energy transducer TonB [Phycisphaeraceae bacterium]
MMERENNLALVIAGLLAVVVHLMGVPLLAVGLERPVGEQGAGAGEVEDLARAVPRAAEIKLGDPKAKEVTTVAWIAYEDYRKLIGPTEETEQPGLQDLAEPVEQGPAEVEPVEGGLERPENQEKTAQAIAAQEAQAGANAALAVLADVPEPIGDGPSLAMVMPGAASAAEAKAEAESEAGRPTSLPRTEQSVTPTQVRPEAEEVQPGGVIVSKGLRITVARPMFSLATRMTAVPRNIMVRVRFGRDGQAREAELLQSSGYADVDGAVLASLYRWRAEGPELAEGKEGVEIRIRYLLARD